MSIGRTKRPQNIMTFVEQLSINSQKHESYQEPTSENDEETIFINPEPEQYESESYSNFEQEYRQGSDNKSQVEKYVEIGIIICVIIFIGYSLLKMIQVAL